LLVNRVLHANMDSLAKMRKSFRLKHLLLRFFRLMNPTLLCLTFWGKSINHLYS
jgi:hypothetical protein